MSFSSAHKLVLQGVMSLPSPLFEASASHLHNQDWSTMKSFFSSFDKQLLELERGKENLNEMLLDMN